MEQCVIRSLYYLEQQYIEQYCCLLSATLLILAITSKMGLQEVFPACAIFYVFIILHSPTEHHPWLILLWASYRVLKITI